MQACGAIKLAIPIASGKPIEPQASQSIASLIPPPTKEDARKRSVILDRQVSAQWHGWPQWQEETTRAGRPATFRGLALYARSAPINGARHRWLAGLGGGLVHQFARVPATNTPRRRRADPSLSSGQKKEPRSTPALSERTRARIFYIFTIITRGTCLFSTLKMTPTYLALL